MIDAEGVHRIVDGVGSVDGVVVERARGRRNRVVVEITLSYRGKAAGGKDVPREGGTATYAIDCSLGIRIEDLSAVDRCSVTGVRSQQGVRQYRRKIAVAHGL